MIEILLMLTLFLRPIYSTVLLLMGIGTDTLPLSIVYIVIAGISYGYLLLTEARKKKFTESFVYAILIACGVLVLQLFVGIRFHGLSGEYLSSVLSYASLSISAFVLGYFYVKKRSFYMLGRVLPFFILVISFLVLYSDFVSVTQHNGLLHIDYNLDYQNCTYYAAYALGLTAYYLLYSEKLQIGRFAQKIRWLFILLLPLQFLVVLTAGGRGGFLLGTFLLLYFGVIYFYRNWKKPAYVLLGIFIVVMVAGVMVAILSITGESIWGFTRLTSFLEKPEDHARSNLYELAIQYFLQKPAFGNGVGAVWFTVGFYSHNIFCDLLCETGVIGTTVWIIILVSYCRKTLKLIRRAPEYQFGLLIFFFVFIMLNFSGYYLTEPMLWFALAFTFFAEENVVGEKNESIIG